MCGVTGLPPRPESDFLASLLRPAVVLAALAALLAVAAAPPAAADVRSDAAAIRTGLTRAVEAGRLSRAEAGRYRLTLRRARSVLTLLPYTRGREVAGVIHDVARQAPRYNRPRSVALFSMLQANADFLAVHPVPEPGSDIVAADGVVYRLFPGHGFQFHPLGNFGALNSHVSGGRKDEAARLALSLVGRAVARGRSLLWEYYFPFGGGRPPWTSGMAQAVAAQALARTAARLGDPGLVSAARRAYRAIPGRLLLELGAGPWIRHYSFSRLVVLNAHLQSLLSLATYGDLTRDSAGAALAASFERSARRMFPRFDTGYWSLYALGVVSPLDYHEYVVRLLNNLERRTGDRFWAEKAARFERYLTEPPLVRLTRRPAPLYPVPAEGFRDAAKLRVWVSKPSSVALYVGGRRFAWSTRGGRRTWVWYPGGRAPGRYPVVVRAVDLAGNRMSARLATVEIRRDRQPPELWAEIARRTLRWRAVDRGTPWLRLTLVLERPKARKVVALGVRPLSGTLRLAAPGLRWEATLVASDSSGNRARVALGPFGGQ